MIRFFDAVVLAHTKLRTHKVRTGITIGIAGILFGLLLSALFVAQGIFDSVERFGKEGLNDRAIITIGHWSTPYQVYDHLEDQKFIALVEEKHQALVAKKTAAAKKYNIPYDAKTEDPSPVIVDAKTKQKRLEFDSLTNSIVQEVANELQQKANKPFNIEDVIARYPSAHVLRDNAAWISGGNDLVLYMKDGKERDEISEQDRMQALSGGTADTPRLSVIDQSVAQPFITSSATFDAASGEVPVILPFKSAEKLLGLKPLSGNATTREKYDRLQDVRKRIGEKAATFCYRNTASQQLLAMADEQQKERKRAQSDENYVAPALQYAMPTNTSCGPVTIAKDTRTAAQKKFDADRISYEKEIGTYSGEPVQYKITVRPVGISGSLPEGGAAFDVAGLVQGLLGSWLGYDEQWAIPADMFRQIPQEKRPAIIATSLENQTNKRPLGMAGLETYLVEFGSFTEARAFLKNNNATIGSAGNGGSDNLLISPFGSGALVIAEMKELFMQVLLWALLIVGGVAVIILSSIIGRTVSEGRRESAIFRAIGARRADVGGIYGMYALLLSLRVVLFALVLGAVIALGTDIFLSEQATLAARYAYAASDTNTSFHFFGVASWYVPITLGAIIVFGLLASIIPVIQSARRNPIKDMRDDT